MLLVFQVPFSTFHFVLDRVSGTKSESALWDAGIHWNQLWFWLVHSSNALGLEEQSTERQREWGVASRGVGWSTASVQLTVVIILAAFHTYFLHEVRLGWSYVMKIWLLNFWYCHKLVTRAAEGYKSLRFSQQCYWKLKSSGVWCFVRWVGLTFWRSVVPSFLGSSNPRTVWVWWAV
jgi:hypothetical protein